ncbi:EamA family transporter [Subsaximicrobium wynnwilliamsii]|uniref:EamA family transporter n=1 Tax=Subsaximicrobium wynnwilliamsii TaxID=291179 RepID=A0A5C6ZG71_9FLAO|nr:EamA family transporter [Subsaximicrobium wynnwilliamsii]TXD82916.1 EamA family transporter [Subsaximicrobium wynnwilliamsii]TXD88637.1 EamA family transporter [Subsaximicrobium wynnwilliamsii]TXE02729.1 EamA family transporter [Subsaximicrobium wynnwilliamsii]
MNTKYYLAVITAFSIWGFFSVVLKSLDDFSAFDILSYRTLGAATIMLVVSLLLRPKVLKNSLNLFKSLEKVDKRRIVIVNILSGLFLALNWYIFIYVMNNVSVSATSLAYLICPILTMVLAYLILKEKLFKLQWLAVTLSFTGCLLLSLGNLTNLFYSMIIALTYALYLVLQRKNQEMDRFLILTFQIGFAVLFLLPFIVTHESTTEKTNFFYVMLALIAVVFTIIPMFLNIYALRGLNSSVVGVFIYVNPLINFGLAIFYFGEKVTPVEGICYALILLSIFLFNFASLKNRIHRRRAAHI